MTEDTHVTLDDLAEVADRIDRMFAELLALARPMVDPGSHVVRYVGVEAATFAEFAERLNAAHTEIVAAGDEYSMVRHVPAKKGVSWGALLTVVRAGPRPTPPPTVQPDEATS